MIDTIPKKKRKKEIPDDCKVKLVAMQSRGCASAWWTQVKAMREAMWQEEGDDTGEDEIFNERVISSNGSCAILIPSATTCVTRRSFGGGTHERVSPTRDPNPNFNYYHYFYHVGPSALI